MSMDESASRLERILEKHSSEFGPYLHDLAEAIKSSNRGVLDENLKRLLEYTATRIQDKFDEKEQRIAQLELELNKKQG